MFMQISEFKRAGLVFGLLTALAACEGGQAGFGFLDGAVPGNDGPPAIRETTLAQTVRISAPSGYCVDTGSRRNGLNGNFVVLAPCAALKVPGIEWPETVAVITVSATRAGLPAASASELEAFVTSPEGRGLLSSKGDATVDVLATDSRQGAFFVRVAEAEAPVAALEPAYWRGLIAAGGRLVSLTVRGYDAEPLGASTGLRMIAALAEDIRNESRVPLAETDAPASDNSEEPIAGLFPKEE